MVAVDVEVGATTAVLLAGADKVRISVSGTGGGNSKSISVITGCTISSAVAPIASYFLGPYPCSILKRNCFSL